MWNILQAVEINGKKANSRIQANIFKKLKHDNRFYNT